MTDYSKIAEGMIKSSEKFIESSNHEIEWINKQIAEQRKKDLELVEYVWSSGVIDKYEMEIFTKGYKSTAMKELLKRRAREYRWRSDMRKDIEFWKNYK